MTLWTHRQQCPFVCEVISVIALPTGFAAVIAGAIAAASARRWVETDGIIVRGEGASSVCWVDDRGGMHEASLGDYAPDGDDMRLWVQQADASRHRFTQPAHARTLRVLGVSLLVPGVIASIVGIIATATG